MSTSPLGVYNTRIDVSVSVSSLYLQLIYLLAAVKRFVRHKLKYREYARECEKFKVIYGGRGDPFGNSGSCRDEYHCWRTAIQLQQCNGSNSQTFFLEVVGFDQLQFSQQKKSVRFSLWDVLMGQFGY